MQHVGLCGTYTSGELVDTTETCVMDISNPSFAEMTKALATVFWSIAWRTELPQKGLDLISAMDKWWFD